MKLVETTEQRDLRGVLRKLFAEHCPTTLVREQRSEAPEFPRTLWRELTGMGVFDLAAEDQELEDVGRSLDALALVAQEAGRVLCPDIVLSTIIAGLVSRDYPGHHRLASGDLAVAIALWAPGNAFDFTPALTATKVTDGWTVSGSLSHVAGVEHAEVVLTTATVDGGPTPARTLLVAIPVADATVETHPAMGGRSRGVTVDRTPVADPYVWGEVSRDQLTRIAQAALALQACEIAGGCAAVIDRTVRYVSEREQFGRAIGTFQAVQHHIADMHIATSAVKLAAERATFWVSRGRPAPQEVAIATMKSSEAYPMVTLTAHQLHGGMGYVRESDLHLWSERAAVLRSRGGNADVAADWLAQEVL